MKIELLELRDEILQWCMDNKTGNERLVILSSGEDSASEIYMRNKIKTGRNTLGISTLHYSCANEGALETKIHECNNDDRITGIIVQLPLAKGWDEHYFINLIAPHKDVDMLTDVNKGRMFTGQTDLLPATTSGVLYTLDDIIGLDNIKGYDVCLIGRSDLVNIPLQKAFTDLDCTIQLCHSKTKDIDKKCRESDIIITAAGKHGLIDIDCISHKTKLILDVSINRVDGKIKGDVVDELYEWADITSNPRGLGSLTCPMLFKNLITMTRGEY